jgi:hypothetical protein
MQAPAQAFSQQTPSTQKPLWQSPFPPQVVPSTSCGTQAPFEQKLPPVQSVLLLQALRQVPVPQTYGSQGVFAPVRQVPPPSQVWADVSVEPEQVSGPQFVPGT